MKKIFFVFLVVFMLSGCVLLRLTESNKPFEYMSSLEVEGDNGVWAVRHYVDEFRQFTDKCYIKTSTSGVFSNSVTNSSSLSVEVLVNKNNVEIELLEYGDYPISFYGGYIKVKMNCNGETTNLGYGHFSEHTKRIVIDSHDCLPLMNAMVENTKVSMLITIAIDAYDIPDKYLFSINTAGFEHAYHEAFVQQ